MPILDKLIPHTDTEQLHLGEAYEIWTQILARYDTLELMQYMESFIHDSDLKSLLSTGIENTIKPQIKKLEDYAEGYKINLPLRPPKKVHVTNVTDSIRDENIFRILFDAAQTQLSAHVKAINISANDNLRSLFKDFLKQDIDNYETIIKYGKFKGWVRGAPTYKS